MQNYAKLEWGQHLQGIVIYKMEIKKSKYIIFVAAQVYGKQMEIY